MMHPFAAFVIALLLSYSFAALATALPTGATHDDRSRASANGTFVAIDDPGGVNGTRAWGISPQGDVVGSYDDVYKIRHGFFWHNGAFTTLDDPRAGHGRPGPLGPQGTTLYDINASGDITGRYVDGNDVAHALVLHHGVFYTLDDPSAARGRGQGTQADGINERGDLVGDYIDGAFTVHGFVLHSGVFSTIDAPHAEQGHYVGTHAFGINRQGQIVLFTEPGKNVARSFLFYARRFTPLNDPRGTLGTFLNGINAQGVIVGSGIDNSNVAHGLLLCNGAYTTHDDPNAGTAPGQGTTLTKINAEGDSAGWYTDGANRDHGFVFRPGTGHSDCDGVRGQPQ